MKLFRSKSKAQLESRIVDLERQLATKENQITYLIRTIRQMDVFVFSMSQCTSWESMRPRFNQLKEQMTTRKVAESNRISSLIESELHSTYDPTKLIESK